MEIFWLKKLAGMLLMPLPALIILAVVAAWLAKAGKIRWAKGVAYSTLTLLLLFSTPWLPGRLLESLEQQYPQFDQANKIDYVVVLGCHHVNDVRLPPTSQLRACSLFRLIEGLRILAAHPDAKLVTSGGSSEVYSNAEAMRTLAVQLGVPAERILLRTQAKDTEQEAQLLADLLAGQQFALVTSAYHMRRAMRIFQHAGLSPIAAPTEHLIKRSSADRYWFADLPKASNISKLELFWHETLGYWWLQLRGH